jgi:hypothetical protein
MNHVTKFCKVFLRIIDKMPRKIFYINHVAKFAAAYQANQCSNAALNILYQQRGKVCRGLPGKPLLKCRKVPGYSILTMWKNFCRLLPGKPLLKCRAKYSISTMQSLPRPTRQTTAQMPRSIFYINHLAKFFAAYQANHCSDATNIFYINNVAKFAAAYQANHCSNDAQHFLYQPRGKVCCGVPGKSLLKCRAKFSISATWQSLPRPTRETTAQMPHEIFCMNHVTKFCKVFLQIIDKLPHKIFYINHVAKFAAAYQANHFSNAAQNIV